MSNIPIKQKGLKTRNGKPVWKNEENDEPYSEKSMSFEYGDGHLVTPTIDPNTGDRYNLDKLFEHYKENGPYDIFTGEKLPVFEDTTSADEYSKWRSNNIFNFDLSDQQFYAGEIGLYSKQDGSEWTWNDVKSDAKGLMRDARDKVYDMFGESEKSEQGDRSYGLGGLLTATKGITTEAGRKMANKKYQRDDKEADTNNDGVLSTREKEIGDAIQKNELVEASHGGIMSGLMGYDEVSGNPIPVGSSAENVRDDIDAKLSTDEYVIPAHVVKWHGLKHIQMMQSEAEMGLMSMQLDGLIQGGEMSEPEEVEVEEIDNDIDVEVATVKVDDKMDDSDEIEIISNRTKEMPLMKKDKYKFVA